MGFCIPQPDGLHNSDVFFAFYPEGAYFYRYVIEEYISHSFADIKQQNR